MNKKINEQEHIDAYHEYRRVFAKWGEVAIETDTAGAMLSALMFIAGMIIALAKTESDRKEAMKLSITQLTDAASEYRRKYLEERKEWPHPKD